jgi:signal peptidase I
VIVAAAVAALAALAVSAAIAWLAHRRWLVVVVHGGSMAPTLREGQQLLARRGRGYLRGDLVVFRAPRPAGDLDGGPDGAPDDPPYRIKRVAAVAGDPVPPWLAAPGHSRVPARHLAVSGDHPVSEDSRHFGLVSDDAVLGYARGRAAAPAAGSR